MVHYNNQERTYAETHLNGIYKSKFCESDISTGSELCQILKSSVEDLVLLQ